MSEKGLLFVEGCAKIHYCQADIQINEMLRNGRPNAKNCMKLHKNFKKDLSKKCLTKNRFCGKIIKSSAAKAEAHRTLKIEQYRKNL